MRSTVITSMAALLILAAAPVLAHHSFEAEYDEKKPVSLHGTVSKMDWMNPHIWVHINVKDDKGNVARWSCEGGNPNSLRRNGWLRDTLKVGDQVSIDGFRAKDGTNTCNMRSVKFADGRKVFAGSSADGGPQQ
jgi:uncharacterized protein DUF6152